MSYDGRTHTVQIGDLTRQLPLFNVAPGVTIAIFNMLGDTDVVEASARLLAEKMPTDAEVLIVPEVKGVPLGQALAVHTGLPMVVVRKFRKPYMINCLEAEVVSITTGVPQNLYLDGKDRHLVQAKRAVLVDDVISTGNTLQGLYKLMDEADATIVGEMAVFTEGDADDWERIIALGHLPIFS